MNIESEIIAAVVQAVKECYGQDVPTTMVQLQKTKAEFEGNLTLVVFPFLKLSKLKPEDTAQQLGDYLAKHCKVVQSFNVVKGFLNLTIAPAAWISLLNRIDSEPRFGEKIVNEQSPLVMVEYSSPNTNKPLHLGHVRNNLLGWSLAQIMEANGNRVVKTNIVNDRGIHICKSMLAWKKWGNGATPESTGKKGDHLIGDYYVAFDQHYRAELSELTAKFKAEGMTDEEAEKRAKEESPLMKEAHDMLVRWEQGDEEVRALWKKMNDWVYQGFDETYKAMGVGFDKIYYESETYLEGKAKVEEGLAKGLFFRKPDGSVWADLSNEGLDQKLLLRADGTSVYMTQDIGTADLRFKDYPIDKMIYVVGNEQNYHFQVLSILLDRLGFKWGKELVHFSYGMVELPNGKMKSREGTVVDADDLMEEMVSAARRTSEELGKFADMTENERNEIARIVGMGALKYFILKVDARKNMLFNPEESIDFNGNTGPFIQYTYARIRSIMRKAEAEGIVLPSVLPDTLPLNEKEVQLIQKLNSFEAVVEQAGKDYSPSGIANYCYELTKDFNQFYHDYSILNAESGEAKTLRLALAKNVAKTIKNGMQLLGIEVPERM
ncbi:arginine--tRNA ligase [Hoylesella loescheii]|uniref:Arginine--tRNA ligase n=1 Tax=Hoylesella loescheii DSM 19665 = JCM 12249 = ATCC 15930 TaxID=1122985 RepID=A0A069QEQ9_HOYLO|nr:arginine--tRNA ligase [Hoylesella loescheii]KDR51373.1 arginine--tRNA ligase [Hoylesella loescheii DSM 19665 = JCM 12249 = ATCC 15930]